MWNPERGGGVSNWTEERDIMQTTIKNSSQTIYDEENDEKWLHSQSQLDLYGIRFIRSSIWYARLSIPIDISICLLANNNFFSLSVVLR